MVEIGIHPPQPSPHPAFWVTGGEHFGFVGPYVPHQDWMCTDWFSHFISAWPFLSLIICIMNGYKYSSDWYMGSKMVTTTYFWVMSGYKFGLAQLGGSAQYVAKIEKWCNDQKSGQTCSTKWSDGGTKVSLKKNDPYMVYQRPEVDIFFRLVGLTYLPTYISIRSSH